MTPVSVEAKQAGYQVGESSAAMKSAVALVNTPQSVSVVSQEQLQDRAVQNIAQVLTYTPGVRSAQGEGNRDAVIIRGVTSTGDFYVDGLRDDVQYYRDVYNMESVEVLKGANGLAFGRAGSGGVVNRTTKSATWSPVNTVSASAGMYDNWRVAADVGSAISKTVAARVNVVSEQSDSYRDGVELRRNGVAPTATIRVGDDTQVKLSYEYFNDLRTADRGVPSFNGKPLRTSNSLFFGNAAQSPTETTVSAGQMQWDHQVNDNVSLSNKTRIADYRKYYQNVYANGNANSGNVQIAQYKDATTRLNAFNQTDVLWKVKTGRVQHDVVAGVEVGLQNSSNARFDNNGNLAVVSVNNPVAIGSFNGLVSRDSNTDTRTLSFYAQDTLTLSPQWQVVAGIRHDRFDTQHQDLVNAANSANVVDREWAPRAALLYKPRADVTTYLSYSKTFVPRSGDQLTSLVPSSANLEPEQYENRELGVKWQMNPNYLVSAALYRLQQNNVAQAIGGGTSILVDGQQVQGLELEVIGELLSGLQLTGGYTYADSEQSNGRSEASQTPRHSFSLWSRYDLNERFGVGLGVVSRSEMFASTTNNVLLPGYARVDAAAFYQFTDKLKVQLNVENLSNTRYADNAHNDNNIMPGSPTNARVTAQYRF